MPIDWSHVIKWLILLLSLFLLFFASMKKYLKKNDIEVFEESCAKKF